jgi:hypothetical protein
MKCRIKVLSIGVDEKDMPQVPAAQAAADFARAGSSLKRAVTRI